MRLMRLLPAIRLATCAGLAAAAFAAEDSSGYTQHADDGRPMLGIEMSPVPLTLQQQENLGVDEGVFVRSVFPGSAAASMGLSADDVILQINGTSIHSMSDLRTEVGMNNVGDQAEVVFRRNGEELTAVGPLRVWPASVPYDPLDPAAEARFRDWQRRRVERDLQDLAQMQQDVDSLRQQLANPALQLPIEGSLAARELTAEWALLKLMPAWKIDTGFDLDAARLPAVVMPPAAAVMVDGDPGPGWCIAFQADSATAAHVF